MRQTQAIEFSTGLFVLLGFTALFFLTTQINNKEIRFGRDQGYELIAKFDNIGSLKTGAPVSMSGVTIGRVESIDFDSTDYRAAVKLRIDAKYDHIPNDSDASIYTAGLLGGQYVGIGAGGSETYFKNHDQIEFTQSAIVLESLISKFLFSMAGNNRDKDKESGSTSPEDKPQ